MQSLMCIMLIVMQLIAIAVTESIITVYVKDFSIFRFNYMLNVYITRTFPKTWYHT